MELTQIQVYLEKLPDEIYKQAEVVEKALLALKEAEHKLDVTKAKLYLKYKNEDTKRTVDYVEALVIRDSEVEAAEVILAEGKWRSANIKHAAQMNTLDCVKKLANIEEAMLRGNITK